MQKSYKSESGVCKQLELKFSTCLGAVANLAKMCWIKIRCYELGIHDVVNAINESSQLMQGH